MNSFQERNLACIGLVTYNEAKWLELHLPHLVNRLAYDIVVVDLCSTDDSRDIARRYGALVTTASIHNNWQASFNELLDYAKSLGYTKMVRLDPDELMFRSDIEKVLERLSEFDVVDLPRINFEVDRYHYCPELYPDLQTRGIRLDKGIRFEGSIVHTTIDSVTSRCYVPNAPIYHYEGLNSMVSRVLKALKKSEILTGVSEIKRGASLSISNKPRNHKPFGLASFSFRPDQPAYFTNPYAPFDENQNEYTNTE